MKMCSQLISFCATGNYTPALETVPYTLMEAKAHKADISNLKAHLGNEKPLYYIKLQVFPSDLACF